MKSDLPLKLQQIRLDLSDWVWHFTNADGSEFDTLKAILQSGHVLGGTDQFCLEPAVCFTEMPLTEAVRQLPTLQAQRYKRLSGYGVGFRKRWIFDRGGLPVIYQPRSMFADLPPTQRWRHCDFDLTQGIDFTWQREWRVPCERLVFTKDDDPTVVVPTHDEGLEAVIENFCIDPERDEVFYDVAFAFVSHEALLAASNPRDIEAYRFQ